MQFSKNPFPYGKYAEEVLSEREFAEYQQREQVMAERHPELGKWLEEAYKGGYLNPLAERLGITAEELLARGAATVVALVQTAVVDNVFHYSLEDRSAL